MGTVMGRTRNPGGGRKKLKPEYNAGKNLKEQMEAAEKVEAEICKSAEEYLK